MPDNSKVARCVRQLVQGGKDKVTAIKICQASTGQSYLTGKPAKTHLGEAVRKEK